MRPFQIAGRDIGPGHPCYIIAELSCNHEGSLAEAERLVEVAAECGVDAVKVQTYTADTITRDFRCRPTGTMWESLDLYTLYQKAYTPWEWHEQLAEKAQSCGLHFFSSPFDETAVDFLVNMGVPALKVASFEVVDLKLLQKMAGAGLPILMSSGMTDYLELVEAVTTLRDHGCRSLALFQCNSGYPASFHDANLRTICAMKAIFEVPVGLSDHIVFAEVDGLARPVAHVSPVEAVRLGANLVEVHLTLDRERARQRKERDEGGFDWAFSRNPDELALMVRLIRQWERDGVVEYETELERKCAGLCSGTVSFTPSERELSSRRLRPSLWVTKPIARGERFRFAAGTDNGNFDSLRPGGGLAIRFADLVATLTARIDAPAGTPLDWSHLQLDHPSASLIIREATTSDAREIWEINRHPSVRAAAFHSGDIAWEDHLSWFGRVLEDPEQHLFVVVDRGEIVAVVRFDRMGSTVGEISISVKDGQRQRGVGAWSIQRAGELYFGRHSEVTAIRAYIKLENDASVRAFEKAGYRRQGEDVVHNHPVWCYLLDRGR